MITDESAAFRNSAALRSSYYRMSKEFEDLLTTQREKNTLVRWRLSDERLVNVLRQFAMDIYTEDDKDFTKFLGKTQELFDHLNPLLAKQEQGNEYFLSKQPKNTHEKKEISVVFGGKYVTKPESIPETLVSRLFKDNPRIFTVSRSKPSPLGENTSKVTHFQAKYLDSNCEKGKNEYLKVLKAAVEEWKNSFSDHTLVIYLTLGFFKGENPYERNLYVAQNFCKALKECFGSNKNASINKNWRVVLTGTDATLPSTVEDGIFNWKKHGEKDETLTIPSYKITELNYIYAMSKLGQYYIVAKAVAKLLNVNYELRKELKSTIKKIEKMVPEAAKSGTLKDFWRITIKRFKYKAQGKSHKEEDLKAAVFQKRIRASIIELNDISQNFDRIFRKSELLQNHFSIAEGISICYTPLHAKPWTKEAIKNENPRIFISQQIIYRLKNAISLEQAVSLHFS